MHVLHLILFTSFANILVKFLVDLVMEPSLLVRPKDLVWNFQMVIVWFEVLMIVMIIPFLLSNHPLNGRITLTLRSTHSDGYFDSCIGYFNPNNCQDDDCYKHFIGINPYDDGTYFYTNGSDENVTSKLSPSQSIIISFENNKVTYSTPHSG
ncbi:hypothetical protein RCL1_007251 [Eukaryota sp. TZLM3-RCL]